MRWEKVHSPWGDICFSFSSEGLYSLYFPPGPPPGFFSQEASELKKGEDPEWLSFFIESLKSYLAGEKVDFTFYSVDLSGYPPFFTQVLAEACHIPYGSVTSYSALAEKVENPKACRAVGNCLNKNRLPLVIPCHRVLTKNGSLGGFGSGIYWKMRLLRLEGVHPGNG